LLGQKILARKNLFLLGKSVRPIFRKANILASKSFEKDK
jgi:hypothetical protein